MPPSQVPPVGDRSSSSVKDYSSSLEEINRFLFLLRVFDAFLFLSIWQKQRETWERGREREKEGGAFRFLTFGFSLFWPDFFVAFLRRFVFPYFASIKYSLNIASRPLNAQLLVTQNNNPLFIGVRARAKEEKKRRGLNRSVGLWPVERGGCVESSFSCRKIHGIIAKDSNLCTSNGTVAYLSL